MRVQSLGSSRLFVVRLNSGEDLLQCIRAAAVAAGIRHGLILAGVGSIVGYHLHVVKTPNIPPGAIFFQGEGAFHILSVAGAIIDGRVHAHITFSNTEKAMGGHLEEGCRILSFGIVVLAQTESADLTDWDGVGQT
jgi:hypothetical protein